MLKDFKILGPSKIEVKRYLETWDSNDGYCLPEKCLNKLFLKTYPLNSDVDEVLIKVSSLIKLYSLVIFDSVVVAKHIVGLNIDPALREGDLSIVDKIANVKMNGKIKRKFYSFATKYCSFHNPNIYPIYDSNVDKMLWYFRNQDKFDGFEREDLKTYKLYRDIIFNFQKHYNLELFNLRQIDKYLFQAGKKYFPNN